MGVFSFNFHRSRWIYFRHQLIEWLSIILLVLLITVPTGLFGWFLFFTDTFTVRVVTVVDARPHTTQEVRSLTEEALNENILFVRVPAMEQRLLTTIPQIRDVYIVRKLPGTLKIIVQEKTPALLLLSQGKYHFVDAQGIVYEEARLDTLPGTVLPIVKNNDASSAISLGAPAVEQTFVEFVTTSQETLPAIAGAEIAEMRIPSLAAREVHIRFDNNWTIRFDTTRPLDAQLQVLRQLLASSIAEEDKARLEYIDLRIPNRVYYKFQESSTPRSAGAPAKE